MSEFILTGFADEIDDALDRQIEGLKKNGISHVELRGVDGRNISAYTPREAEDLRKRLDAAGIGVSALGTPCGKQDIGDDFAPHLAMFKTMLDVAEVLGTRYLRMFSFFLPNGEDPARFRGEVLRRLEAMLSAAEGRGILLTHENERHIYGENQERCLDLLAHFGGKLRAVFDPGNFVVCGVNVRDALPALRPYIEYLHIKDARMGDAGADKRDMGFENVMSTILPAGKGDGDIEWVLARMRADGFSGFVSLEPHLVNNPDYPGSGLDKFTVAADHLKAIIARVSA